MVTTRMNISVSGCGWYEGLENAEGISVGDLPDGVQKRLKSVGREIRKLDEVMMSQG